LEKNEWRSTTVLCVRRNSIVAMGADGQVTMNNVVVKEGAVKVRKLRDGKVFVGIAGSAADGLTLLERLEEQIKRFPDNLPKAAVELAKQWRSDKALRRLEALIAVADKDHSFMLSGSGDIVEPDDGLIAIGSGGSYALAADRALMKNTELSAEAIVKESLNIAADICIFTNHNITVEVLS
jgi:ATP-dependent HslUV protease, peptidase subunit HslV